MNSTELATVNPAPLSEFNQSYQGLIKFVKSKLKEGTDYGIIPGTKKKSLYKPGAEKIAFLFQLKPKLELIKEVEDWERGFFFYKYKCTLVHFHTGKPAGEAVRSCNSKEKKYAYTTKAEKWATEEEKARSIGKKKNEKYGTYDLILRKTPDEAAEQANTIDAMAQKRAIVAATVQATMATEIFDADISENDEEAPGKSVTKEDDPRRAKITMSLYGTANRHGWDNDWIHRAIKKKWGVESITECSNSQLEELRDFISSHYKEVEKGEKPILLTEEVPPAPPIQGEVVNEEDAGPVAYTCKGPKHKDGPEVATTTDKPWCSDACKEAYFANMRGYKFKNSVGKTI